RDGGEACAAGLSIGCGGLSCAWPVLPGDKQVGGAGRGWPVRDQFSLALVKPSAAALSVFSSPPPPRRPASRAPSPGRSLRWSAAGTEAPPGCPALGGAIQC